MSTLSAFAKLGILLVVPYAVLIAGGIFMTLLADPCNVLDRRYRFLPRATEPKPLNRRYGYNKDDVKEVWGYPKRKPALDVQRRLLEYDLLFPIVYGAALALCLWVAWSILGGPFAVGWLFVPVVLAMLADWTENLVQLEQLARYSGKCAQGLDARSIQIASFATRTKLTFFGVSWAFLLALVLGFVWRYFRAG